MLHAASCTLHAQAARFTSIPTYHSQTHPHPPPSSNFANLQEQLLGFVLCVTLPLHNKLAGAHAALRTMLREASEVRAGTLSGL